MARLSPSLFIPFFFFFFHVPLFSIFPCISSSSLNQSAGTSVTIPLSHFRPKSRPSSPSLLPWQKLRHLAAASLVRARRLKNPHSKSISTIPLSARGYGGYSISLSFGTPPQTIPFVMDTGSDVVWFPCTRNYVCQNCSFNFPNQPPRKIPSFIPKLSSSCKILGCLNPKCGWIHKFDPKSRCRECGSHPKNCTQTCPPYLILYGTGDTGGIMLSETLDLAGERRVPDFVVGCSLFSSQQPAGIAGFGRGRPSLPSQLGLRKFSYCLLSHRFDDSHERAAMVLESGGTGSGNKTAGVSYTPFVKNPKLPGNDAFSVYYYVGLRKITVGGKRVKVPYKYLVPGTGGDGGTIVDSGTTFTFMARPVFNLVAAEFSKQARRFPRAKGIEGLTGLRPCFNVSGNKPNAPLSLPDMRFHFKGGAEMKLPLANYFSVVGDTGALCLTVVTDGGGAGGVPDGGGPSIILGNFQMQNFYVEYDLGNERLGFRPQRCNQ